MKNFMNISNTNKYLTLLLLFLASSINSNLITLKTKAFTGAYGGTGGSYFNDGLSSNINEVLIGHGTYIDSIQTSTSNFRNKKHGGSGGTLYRWSVPPGHCITTIWVRSGAYVDSLQFKTDKGAVSPKFGGDGGNFYEVNLQGCLKGIYGRSGAYVDQIGFYY